MVARMRCLWKTTFWSFASLWTQASAKFMDQVCISCFIIAAFLISGFQSFFFDYTPSFEPITIPVTSGSAVSSRACALIFTNSSMRNDPYNLGSDLSCNWVCGHALPVLPDTHVVHSDPAQQLRTTSKSILREYSSSSHHSPSLSC